MSGGSGGGAGGKEHYLGGGPHDAALVLWDEMQNQAQWEQIRNVQAPNPNLNPNPPNPSRTDSP